MRQIVIYKGVTVHPVERSGNKVLIRTTNAADARRADIPFKDLRDGAAIFEAWVPDDELVPVNTD